MAGWEGGPQGTRKACRALRKRQARSFQKVDSGLCCELSCACVHAKLFQSCPPLCDPMDCSPPGSSVHGILQARTLAWVAVPSPGDLPDPGIDEKINVCQVSQSIWYLVTASKQTSIYSPQSSLMGPLAWTSRHGWETDMYPRCQHNASSVELSPPQACLGHSVCGLQPSLLGSRLPDRTSLGVRWLRTHLLQEGNGSLLQYSCLENPMDRGAWWATVHGVVRDLVFKKKKKNLPTSAGDTCLIPGLGRFHTPQGY